MGSCECMLNKAMDNNIYIIIYTHTYDKAQHYCTIDVIMYVVHKKVIFEMSGGIDSTVVVLMMKLTGKILFNTEFRETMKLVNTIKSNSSISRISTLNSQVI